MKLVLSSILTLGIVLAQSCNESGPSPNLPIEQITHSEKVANQLNQYLK